MALPCLCDFPCFPELEMAAVPPTRPHFCLNLPLQTTTILLRAQEKKKSPLISHTVNFNGCKWYLTGELKNGYFVICLFCQPVENTSTYCYDGMMRLTLDNFKSPSNNLVFFDRILMSSNQKRRWRRCLISFDELRKGGFHNNGVIHVKAALKVTSLTRKVMDGRSSKHDCAPSTSEAPQNPFIPARH
uniref:MATH domain-containing protein n=1 Tax=Steinernema glaseri TaxID=37863 RepID=A0A1I7ZW77_9BILA